MELNKNHKIIWKILIVVAGLALVATSFLPYLTLLQ